RALIRLEAQAAREAGETVEQVTSGGLKAADLDRDKFLLRWLRSRDVELPDLRRGTIEQWLTSCPSADAVAAQVLRARLAVRRATPAKLEQALANLDEDGRVPDLLVYHKAHTGRWAARAVQPHNLPRPHKDLKDLTPLVEAVHDAGRLRSLVPP